MEKQLRVVLQQPDTVLFVGSGVSCWSGLPSWSRLIHELVDFVVAKGHDATLVKREAERGELLQAASYAFDGLTRPQIGEFIRQTCRVGKARPHEIHRRLVTLGPRCFVTTNYDRLLEASFQKWQADRYYRTVTNRQVTETAEIVGARSIDFLFKPHGDVEDAESIILTREQYRALAPGGERHNALETLQMLLASRPFVYVGFGLRDPDFLYVRDLLANTYKGAVRDHYAIMADVSEGEANYWRRNYGIHLITYPTQVHQGGSCGHEALLSLLDQLRTDAVIPPLGDRVPSTEPDHAATALSLARHASRLSRVEAPATLFPLHVHRERRRDNHTFSMDAYEGCSVETILDDGPRQLVLIGHPGAGKSFAVRHSAARLAESLHDRCLAETFEPKLVIVPIVSDLKLYAGDLWTLVEKTLPPSLSLTDLLYHFSTKIYLDGFNEVPREYIEKGEWEVDLGRFLKRASQASVIITSRTGDGLQNLDLPTFCLDEVNEAFVKTEIEKRGLKTAGLLQRETLALLQRPFFFHLILSKSLTLPTLAQPRDIFVAFLSHISSDFEARFGTAFDIMRPLASFAHDAINRGEEAMPIAAAIRVIQDHLATAEIRGISGVDIVNWLVAKDFLLPLSGGRVMLFHQSITEYLAATELSRLYLDTSSILREKLILRRWDHTLFLTLSLLAEEQAAKFIKDMAEMDFIVALSAAKYIDSGRDVVVEQLLQEVLDRAGLDYDVDREIGWAIAYSLPISLGHESLLRSLLGFSDMVGGAAASRLMSLRGPEARVEILGLLVQNCHDYNFCAQVADALRRLTSDADIPVLVGLSDRVQKRLTDGEINCHEGFDSALGTMLSRLTPETVFDAFYDPGRPHKEQGVRISVLCEFLTESKSPEALKLSGDLVLKGIAEAAFSLQMIALSHTGEADLNWSSFGEAHILSLSNMVHTEHGGWAVDALRAICCARPDLVSPVRDACANAKGVLPVALLSTICVDNQESICEALTGLLEFSLEQLDTEPVELLSHLGLDWRGHEDLFVALLRLRHAKLAWKLMEGIRLFGAHSDCNLGTLEIGPIEWWLDWLEEVPDTGDGWWLHYRLSDLLAHRLRLEVKNAFVGEFNKSDSQYRRVLARTILLARTDLTTDQFTNDAISFLLADLSHRPIGDSVYGHLLGRTATEAFVMGRLLPLLPNAEEPLRGNIVKVLHQAGERHGKRYVAV
jgi:hypothetical protein